jgi:peptide/nickel transport system substrate-binding protein
VDLWLSQNPVFFNGLQDDISTVDPELFRRFALNPNVLTSRLRETISSRMLLSLLVIFVVGLSACGSGTTTTQKNTALQVALQDGPFIQNFNPYSPTILTQPGRGLIYESLLFINGQQGGTITPWLASSYQFSADATMLIFHLRPGVEWSDGHPISSADVVFTLNLLKQYPALDTYGLWTYVKRVAAPDASTVVVTLKRPYTPMLWYLGGQTPILSQQHWSTVGDPTTYADPLPVGTGPYVLTSFTPQLIILSKNPRYWQPGKPEVTTVDYKAFNSSTSVELSLDKGQLDWAGIAAPDLQQTYVSRDPLHNHYWAPSNYLIMLYLNLDTYPFNLLPVRQAISQAINRQQVAQLGETGSESPANPSGIVLPAFQNSLSADYAQASFTVDRNQANQLLQRAGFTRGV